jgi:hypothetical protein
MPVLPPYIGYRGDLLGVLANAMYERPPVAEAVAAVPGAVELLLAQVWDLLVDVVKSRQPEIP